jgi:hypothetical protein
MTDKVYLAHPLPPVARFPRNIHTTAHYGTIDSMSFKKHPLIADHQGQVILMQGSMTAAARGVWNILNLSKQRRYNYGKVRLRKPDTASNRNSTNASVAP